jgi:glycerol uptake facilitator protein
MIHLNPYIAEFVGTMLLVLLGDGVVANVVLGKTKGRQGGWIVITFGWAMGVFVGVLCAQDFSGAHLNPAVTLSLAFAGKFAWAKVFAYVLAQMAGGFAGAALVLALYYHHFGATEDQRAKLAVFCTGPEIRRAGANFFSEGLGTFVLVFVVLFIAAPSVELPGAQGQASAKAVVGLGSLGAMPVALLVLAIGLSLGGTTGYAINPARDLGPRLAHALLPVPGKGVSDWRYAWIPVFGPVAGGLIAVLVYALMAKV